MWAWALRSLWHDTAGFVASILATAGAFLLVMVFQAVYVGESQQVVAYVDKVDADIWVLQRGVSNMHMATSYLSADKVAAVRRMPGVEQAEGILYLNTVVSAPRYQWFAYVVGLDSDSTLAAPWSVSEGVTVPGPGQISVPRILAEQAGLSLGDVLRIADRTFTIAGLTEETFSMANSVLFVSRLALEDLLSAFDIVSFIALKTDGSVDPEVLARQIAHDLDVEALTKDQFVTNDRQLAMQMGVETIALMTVIGGTLAAVLVAFTVYAQVLRQRAAHAAIRALGATAFQLLATVLMQAFIVTLTGVAVAGGLAAIAMPLITAWIPQIQLQFSTAILVNVAVVGLVVALVASWWPARQLIGIDPVRAFRT